MSRLLRETKYRVNEYPFKDITEKIISYAIEVHSNLGPGLLESVYEEALGYEFDLRDIKRRSKEIDSINLRRHRGGRDVIYA